DAPADVHLGAQVDLVVAFQVAKGRVVVRVAVADHLDRDLLGVAPAERVDEIADQGAVKAGTVGQVGGGAHAQAVEGAGVVAPGQFGVELAAGAGLELGQRRTEGRGHHKAGNIELLV